MAHRITALHFTDFQKIRDVEIRPDADRLLILLGGQNGAGKTSILRALSAAFGGKKQQPADPVRHGADEANLWVELDGGDLEVRRVIQPDGESVLEVRDRLGAVKAPQAVLDGLIGSRFLDPLHFLSLPAKEQRAALMRVIPSAKRIAELDEKRERGFAKRTEVNRDLKKAQGELARLPEVTVGTPIDVAALTEESRTLAEKQHTGAQLAVAKDAAVRATQEAVSRRVMNTHAIEQLEKQLAELRAQQEPLAAEVRRCETAAHEAIARLDAAAAEWKAEQPRRDQIDADLRRAADHNRAVFSAEAKQQRRADVAAEVALHAAEHEKLTKLLAAIDARKAEILAAEPLPVEGLGIDEDGLTLPGPAERDGAPIPVPFAQASDAQRWRVALAIATAAAPQLDDVWIRSGNDLDDDSLELVAKHAAAAGKRVWIERVGTRDPGVIEIRDGRARTGPPDAAKPTE